MAYYWKDVRRESQRISVRQNGGKCLMFWGAIPFYGVGLLVVTSGRQNAASYCNTLEKYLPVFIAETFGEQTT